MNPELPIYNARTTNERLMLSLTLRAAYSWMLLALGGSYGITSYLVSQRRR